jgi:protein O-mannosyl-transferase
MKWINNHKVQYTIVILFPFLLYFNTLFNEYALDDEAVIVKNTYTIQGISGIKDLVTHDHFYGFIQQKTGLYRPIPLITHAIEYELFGENAMISHFVNILFYILSSLLLFYLIKKYIFKNNPLIAFITTLLFISHPTHTEVVANIKSRDELLSLIFMLINIIAFLKYFDSKNKNHYTISIIALSLALLSKESAITSIIIAPLILFYSSDKKVTTIMYGSIPLLMIGFIYLITKYYLTGFISYDNKFVINTPYLYASSSEAFATKVYVILKYITKLLFPISLSHDYSYNQIPYINISSIEFIFSILTLSLLIIYALLGLRHRNVLSLSIIIFFLTISIVSNLVIPIAVQFAERFLFLPSIGFCFAIGFFIAKLFKVKKYLILGYLIPLIVLFLYSFKTVARNFDWKNTYTLIEKDINECPNSIRILSNIGTYKYFYQVPDIKNPEEVNEEKNKAISWLRKANTIDKKFPEPYISLIMIYINEKRVDSAACFYDYGLSNQISAKRFLSLAPDISHHYVLAGRSLFENKQMDSAIKCFEKSLQYNPQNPDAYWNLGGIYLEKGQVQKTVEYWTKTLSINPNYPNGQLLERIKKDFNIQ